TISSGLNSMAAVILEDIFKRLSTKQLSNKRQTTISKLLCGAFNGPILGLFLLALFFPQANSKGALSGFIICLLFQIWILVGSILTINHQNSEKLPVSTDGCFTKYNISLIENITSSSSPSLPQSFVQVKTKIRTFSSEGGPLADHAVNKQYLSLNFHHNPFYYSTIVITVDSDAETIH
ncbi:unnamed protein product, partial [Didymodactylos carnosus]